MKTTILSIFLVLVILISSVNIYALGEISPKVAPQYPLLDFELSTTSFPVNSTFQLTIRSIPTNAYDDGYDDFRWTVSGDDFSISSTGVLTTPNYSASTTLTIQHIPSYISKSYVINVDTIDSGYYRIKNAETGKYLQAVFYPDWQTVTNYETVAITNDISMNQIWYIEKNTGSTWYTIRHVAESAASPMYLSVNDLGMSTDYTSLSFSCGSESTKWRIRYRNGAYNIFIGTSPTKSIIQSISSPDSPLTYGTYSNNSVYNDEWIFEPINMNANLVAVNDPTHTLLHSAYFDNADIKLSALEYNVSLNEGTSFTINGYKNLLRSSGIFFSDSHGGIAGESTYVSLQPYCFYSTDICYSPGSTPSIDLSECWLAAFIACNTAESSYHLPLAALCAGAKYAIGTHTTIGCREALSWEMAFFNELCNPENTIITAFYEASSYVYGDDYLDVIEIYY